VRLPFALLVAASTFALPWSASAGEPRLVASFDDPAGDATGPGSYVLPGDSEFEEGDFDLRRFAVFVDGDVVIFEVTLGAKFRKPATTQRSNSTPVELWNNIYFQNIDIYIDTDRTPGSGSSVCIPGRRVAFAGGRTWEVAVVLTPQPGPAREVTQGALGEGADRIYFPRDLHTRGRTVIARVPVSFLGGPPRKDWGYSVQVSGARWERSFTAVDRLVGRHEVDAYTMPVIGVREAWAFGGAPSGTAHPRVVDVLLPAGVDQRTVLGSFDSQTGAFAQVPFVELEGVASPPPTPGAEVPAVPAKVPGVPTLLVVDVSGGVITMQGTSAGLAPLRIGRVLGNDGRTVARVVVLQVVEGGAVARAVEGGEQIAPSLRVEFDEPAPRPVNP
jgi:hypothetical protein